MTAAFLRVIERDDKPSALREAIRVPDSPWRFDVDPESFSAVPRSPFAYWVRDRLRRTFTRLAAFESEGRCARQGGVPGDDFRRLRLHWELSGNEGGWSCYAKGGSFSRFYADIHLEVRWDSARSSFHAFTGLPHRPSIQPASCGYYFRPGLTWPRRTQGGLSIRAMPTGCIFADKGPAAFVDGDDPPSLLALLAILNSRPFGALVELQMAFGSYEVGVLQRTPIPDLTFPSMRQLADHAGRAWSIKRGLDARVETSHAFVLPALLQVQGVSLSERADVWAARVKSAEEHLARIQQTIDELCFDLYRIDGEDRGRIEEGFYAARDDSESDDSDEDAESQDVETRPLVASFLSWALGVAFGRFDLRLATGDREPPTEPRPFDPLPPCSPGMLTGDDGLPLGSPPPGYPIDFPRDGILADDAGDDRDLVSRTRQVLELVFGDDADAVGREAAEIVDPRGRDVRGWFAQSFFEDHIKRHSKSRRKAPVYWQLATPSASYSVWLHLHRLTKDTFYKVLNDFAEPKLRHEQRNLESLTQDAAGNPTPSQRKEIDAQERFVEELRSFRDEVARIAPLWNPDLDDGVIINFAPLWRLVPQHRAWQKECKKVWDKLCKGDYDWAHLAMHLWPERVVPKCAKDRSLAIAHGLEDVFWHEDSDGKWKPLKVDQARIDELIKERVSAAVKDALKGLLDAPAPAKPRKGSRKKSSRSSRTRRGRAASSVGGDT